jgi:hypothetical protein
MSRNANNGSARTVRPVTRVGVTLSIEADAS